MYLATFALVSLLLTGCSGENSAISQITSKVEAYSKLEACREIYSLIGKATDKMVSQDFEQPFDFTDIAKSFELLSQKNLDSTLKESIAVISESLRKMSNEATYFEGNTMYLGEITNLSSECALK